MTEVRQGLVALSRGVVRLRSSGHDFTVVQCWSGEDQEVEVDEGRRDVNVMGNETAKDVKEAKK